ncbi:MAG: hypothetical protein ABJN84_06400 [Flavobacteriaceae bacterium]
MSLAYPFQKFQDWFTQQWVIVWGQRITPEQHQWLVGPFGKQGVIGDSFVNHLAKEEDLTIQRNVSSKGLISSIRSLNFSDVEYAQLSTMVIDFYEHTANYTLTFSVRWNPVFKTFGKLVNVLFSRRINQLNVPIRNLKNSDKINSEIITLTDPATNKIKYTVWHRTFESSGQVLYSGIYGICSLPSGKVCVKATFPLPNGNATVIMHPSVGPNGGLQLNSSGNRFGDAGFYFVLKDSKGKFWSNYIRSFHDLLQVYKGKSNLEAEQTLSLWGMKVVRFAYGINPK